MAGVLTTVPVTHEGSDDETALRHSSISSPQLSQQGCCATAVKRRKWILSITYFMAFFGLGGILASPGPTLVLLAAQTGSSISTIGAIFVGRACGGAVGSVLGGLLVDRISGNALLGFGMALSGLTAAAIPFVSSVGLLAATIGGQGLAMGLLDTGANVMLICLHGAEVNPYMQAMHFFFALGAFVAPLLVRAVMVFAGDLKYGIAFWVQAALVGIVAIALFLQSSPKRRGEEGSEHAARESDTHSKPSASSSCCSGVKCSQQLLVLLAAACLFFYVGAETGFGGYIASFVVTNTELGMTLADGQLMTSVFWGFLALGRLVAVPIAVKFSPLQMLVGTMVGCTLAAAGMVVLPSSPAMMWAGSGLLGLCMSCIFPTVIAYVETIMDVHGKHASLFVVGGALGEMLLPLGMSQVIATHPVAVLTIVLVATILQCVAGLLLYLQGRRMVSPRGHRPLHEVASLELASTSTPPPPHAGSPTHMHVSRGAAPEYPAASTMMVTPQYPSQTAVPVAVTHPAAASQHYHGHGAAISVEVATAPPSSAPPAPSPTPLPPPPAYPFSNS